MSNAWFSFKKFHVAQELGAMKVTTDACIQGAWTPLDISVNHALDIGAGTGLLSLMLAQRNPQLIIDAIELDTAAAREANDNVQHSIWKDHINVLRGDVRTYRFDRKYDLIITNPPFFNKSLLGKGDSKNMARHTLSLSYAELLKAMYDNLAIDGYVSVLLPATEYQLWYSLAATSGWAERMRLSVKHRVNAPVKRIVGIYCKHNDVSTMQQELVITNEQGGYTQAFIDLLSPFYLNL